MYFTIMCFFTVIASYEMTVGPLLPPDLFIYLGATITDRGYTHVRKDCKFQFSFSLKYLFSLTFQTQEAFIINERGEVPINNYLNMTRRMVSLPARSSYRYPQGWFYKNLHFLQKFVDVVCFERTLFFDNTLWGNLFYIMTHWFSLRVAKKRTAHICGKETWIVSWVVVGNLLPILCHASPMQIKF